MTPADIERLARQAGLTDPDLKPWMTDYGNAEAAIRLFAALVLEEAAKVCDAEFWRVTKARGGDAAVAAGECGAAIRALKPVAT